MSNTPFYTCLCPWCRNQAFNGLTPPPTELRDGGEITCQTCRQPITVRRCVYYDAVRRYGIPADDPLV